MSSSNRMTRSKGQPAELSLPTRTRQKRQSTNPENQQTMERPPTSSPDGLDRSPPETAIQTPPLMTQPPRPTSSQSVTGHIAGERPPPRAPAVRISIENPCQSTPLQVEQAKMWETPVPVTIPAPTRPITPHIPLPSTQDSGSHLSQLSCPLFTEDRYSTSSEDDQGACNAESTQINKQGTPSQATTVTVMLERPGSTQRLVDHSTQGDPDQVAPQTPSVQVTNHYASQFKGVNNYFVPDFSGRHIHAIQDKVRYEGYLENGNNAYLMELPELKDMLRTTRFLMDEETGQFYAVYGNTYQRMCTKPRILDYWSPGGLLDKLAEMRHSFGYAGLAGPIPSPPPKQATSAPADGIIPKKSPPKSILFKPPTFSLEKLTRRLPMNERVQVYHNYISAISNMEHK